MKPRALCLRNMGFEVHRYFRECGRRLSLSQLVDWEERSNRPAESLAHTSLGEERANLCAADCGAPNWRGQVAAHAGPGLFLIRMLRVGRISR